MDMTLKKNNLFSFLKKQALLLSLFVIVVVFSLITDNFLSKSNLYLILQQASIVGIAGCAVTYVLVGGNFDLSIGAIITLSVLLSIDLHDKVNPVSAVLVAVAACLIVGLINGYLVGFLRVHSMIVTLGMMTILSGVMLLYTGGQLSWIDKPNATWFRYFGREKVLDIPIQVILLFILVVASEFVLKRTSYGMKVHAAGGNANALRYSGIDDRRIVLSTFVFSAFMAALAGLVMGSRTMKYQTEIAFGYEFDVISAVILGGTSLSGGKGSVVKMLIGVLILSSLNNGFLMLGLQYCFQWIVQGLVILLMVFFDVFSSRKEQIE